MWVCLKLCDGDTIAASLLAEILYRSNVTKFNNGKNPVIVYSLEEWADVSGMTINQVRKALVRLDKLSIIRKYNDTHPFKGVLRALHVELPEEVRELYQYLTSGSYRYEGDTLCLSLDWLSNMKLNVTGWKQSTPECANDSTPECQNTVTSADAPVCAEGTQHLLYNKESKEKIVSANDAETASPASEKKEVSKEEKKEKKKDKENIDEDYIAQGKQKILDEYQQEQSRVRADLDRLRQERQTLQSQVNAARQDTQKLTASLSQAIMKSFESAKEKGIATLADTALFQALLGQAPVLANGMVMPSGTANTINMRRLGKLEGSFEETLKACGLDRTHVRLWKILATLAVKHHFVITFKGFAASYAAQTLASSVSKEEILAIDTPLGLMQADELDRALEQQTGWDALIVYNLNRIPLDVLGSKLEEMTLSRWLKSNTSEKALLCTLAQGESSFPVTERYRYLGPIFDLENPAPSGAAMPDLYEALTETNPAHNIPKIWVDKITALIDEATAAAPEDKKVMLGLIQHAFIPPHVINAIAHSSNTKTGGSVVSIKPL